MEDRDGVYLSKVWVCSSNAIAVTYQSNDLSKPATLQTSYSNSFELVDSLAIRQLTQSAEQLDSGSLYPYRTVPAYVIDNGEYVFRGIAQLTEFSAGWKVVLYEEKRNLFDRLDRSIRTADLSRFDHDWTIENINARTASIDGVCYPLIDYGLLSGNSLPADTIFPAVYAHTIVRQMLKEEGYSLVGSLMSDELFKRLIIPFSEQEGTNHDDKWVTDRKARVTQDNEEYFVARFAFDSGHVVDRVQPFNIDNRLAETWTQGVLHNYNTTTFEYVCDTNMRVIVDAVQSFKIWAAAGSVECKLWVDKNGQEVAQRYFSSGSPYNLLKLKVETLTLKETITCQKGDRLQIRFLCQRQTKIGGFQATIYNDPFSSWAAFTPDITLATGDNWPVARNLPDITGTKLLGDIARIYCGTWSVDTWRKQIKLVGLSDTIANTANAVDWSNRLDTGKEPSWTPKLEPYAQANYLKWKEIDETKATDGALNYGDGVISITGDTLETEVDLFELLFAASTQSISELSGYGNPVLVKTRTVTGSASNATINKQNTTPRLLLVAPEAQAAVPVQTKRFAKDGITIEYISVQLKACWFGPRPNVAIKANTGFCLAFSPVKNLRGEQTLIQRHYPGLQRVLSRMRVFPVNMRLLPEDISGLDFGIPIRLKRVEVGSLVLTDHFFYLNAINSYRANQPCTVTLIGF